MPNITCVRCGQSRDQQAFRPFQNEIGLRAFEQICAVCWAEWLKTQQQLINHYGLNLREAKAKTFLFEQMEQFLFKTPRSGDPALNTYDTAPDA
jgi:Fe-S cluster biosynthesis and repair protein YggX